MLRTNFEISESDKQLAKELVNRVDRVGHIDVNEILFLRETETEPPNGKLACFMKLEGHPINHFTPEKYAVVIYDRAIDYMTENQQKVLLLHELMHYPLYSNKLEPHSVQDFRQLLDGTFGIGVGWYDEGVKVPDILGVEA